MRYALEFLRDEAASLRARKATCSPIVAIARGFHSASRDLFRLDERPRELFLSDFQRLRCGAINGEARIVCNDKLLYERFFGQWLPVPPNVAIIQRGEVRGIAPDGALGDRVGWTEIVERARDGVVAKPIGGDSGIGIVVIRPSDGGWTFNGEPITTDEIERRLPRLERYLLSAFVVQAHSSAALNPRTTNTLRVLTMFDERSGRPFIARAVQRIGIEASMPVDNWTQGALSALIDLETGRLGPGAQKIRKGKPSWHAVHPECGAPIEGTHVHHWHRIRDDLLAVAARLPMLPYIGWDVIPTEESYSVIEANYRTGVNMLQVHGGLLADERVREFYRRWRIISDRQRDAAARLAGPAVARQSSEEP